MPSRPAQRIRLLLLPQPSPPQPRPLPRQGPLPVRPDPPRAIPQAPRHRGSRVRPARHLQRYQCARHRLHRREACLRPLQRPPPGLLQLPRTPHRPPSHPGRPRRLQGALGHHPRSQPRHRPARPHHRNPRRTSTRRRRNDGAYSTRRSGARPSHQVPRRSRPPPPHRSRHPERSEEPLYFAGSATTERRRHPLFRGCHSERSEEPPYSARGATTLHPNRSTTNSDHHPRRNHRRISGSACRSRRDNERPSQGL
jgi:hypothetical protein